MPVPQFGFVDIEHLFDRPVEEVGQATISQAIDRTVAFYNGKANDMMSSLVNNVSVVKERYLGPVGGGSLQPIDEDGNPYPTLQYEGYDVGYPIVGAADAMGTNRLSRAAMTVEDANNWVKGVTIKDKKFLINHSIAALLTKEERTFLDRTRLGYTGGGSITVKPLANGDATTYMVNGSSNETDNHYLAQTAAIADGTNPYPVIYKELTEHLEVDDAEVDVYIADNLVASTSLLANFLDVVDPGRTPGSGEAVINKTIPKGIGDKAIGYTDRCNVISMRKLPDNYMFAIVRGAKPLGMRTYPFAGWQGLFKEEHNVDGNHVETRLLRFAGFGVRDRTAAVCYQVSGGDTTYDTPALYQAPLAVA